MENTSIRVVNDSTENTKIFGNLDSAVEYCQGRLHENFTVYVGGQQSVVDKIKTQLIANLSNVKIR